MTCSMSDFLATRITTIPPISFKLDEWRNRADVLTFNVCVIVEMVDAGRNYNSQAVVQLIHKPNLYMRRI